MPKIYTIFSLPEGTKPINFPGNYNVLQLNGNLKFIPENDSTYGAKFYKNQSTFSNANADALENKESYINLLEVESFSYIIDEPFGVMSNYVLIKLQEQQEIFKLNEIDLIPRVERTDKHLPMEINSYLFEAHTNNDPSYRTFYLYPFVKTDTFNCNLNGPVIFKFFRLLFYLVRIVIFYF